MKFTYHLIPQWPPLAWLAECFDGRDSMDIHHGEWLETKEEWFVEGAWDGSFPDGGFDLTNIVSGSGAHLRDGGVCFVSSGANTDRLHSFQKEGRTIVSNSLCCLLAWIDADPDYGYLNYTKDFAQYRFAVFGDHVRIFPSSAGPVQLTYYANLVFDGKCLELRDKPFIERQFRTFEDYHAFMKSTMAALAANAGDGERVHPFGLICALSKGYDSPTVAAIASSVCEVEAVTFDKDRDGYDDCGQDIAKILEIPCHIVDRDAWYSEELAEVPFLACSGSVGDMPFKSAEKHLKGKVLLAGGPGADAQWNRNASWSEHIHIGGGSFLGLTEYRLWAGFLSCSVPLWAVPQIRDVMRISGSEEMEKWHTGGDYSRPICRRIVEEAGVPGHFFGVRKSGVSFAPPTKSRSLSVSSRKDFLAWLKIRTEFSVKGEGPHISVKLAKFSDWLIEWLQRVTILAMRLSRRLRLKWMKSLLTGVYDRLKRPFYHHHYVVHWAIDRAKKRYQV